MHVIVFQSYGVLRVFIGARHSAPLVAVIHVHPVEPGIRHQIMEIIELLLDGCEIAGDAAAYLHRTILAHP